MKTTITSPGTVDPSRNWLKEAASGLILLCREFQGLQIVVGRAAAPGQGEVVQNLLKYDHLLLGNEHSKVGRFAAGDVVGAFGRWASDSIKREPKARHTFRGPIPHRLVGNTDDRGSGGHVVVRFPVDEGRFSEFHGRENASFAELYQG